LSSLVLFIVALSQTSRHNASLVLFIAIGDDVGDNVLRFIVPLSQTSRRNASVVLVIGTDAVRLENEVSSIPTLPVADVGLS
jgi:hypothetical protein